jgi:hypothetical protein
MHTHHGAGQGRFVMDIAFKDGEPRQMHHAPRMYRFARNDAHPVTGAHQFFAYMAADKPGAPQN